MGPGSFGIACLLAAVLLVWHGTGEFRKRFCERPDGPVCTRLVPVEVEGAVKHPGVYLFDRIPTIRSVLDRCGAPASLAVPHRLRGTRLRAGSLLVVHTGSGGARLRVVEMDAARRIVLGIPLDLNRADERDLAAVPGISVRKARTIVRFRAGAKGAISVDGLVKARILSEQQARRIRTYVVPWEGAR